MSAAAGWTSTRKADRRLQHRPRWWQRQTGEVRAYLWHDERRAAATQWLAGRTGRHACGDGKHRQLLEADFQRVGGAVRTAPGQRSAFEGGAWAQDGRQRRRVDRRSAAAWTAQRPLRARPAAARIARVGALSPEPGSGAHG